MTKSDIIKEEREAFEEINKEMLWVADEELESVTGWLESALNRMLSATMSAVMVEIEKFDINYGTMGEPVSNPLMRLKDVKRFLLEVIKAKGEEWAKEDG